MHCVRRRSSPHWRGKTLAALLLALAALRAAWGLPAVTAEHPADESASLTCTPEVLADPQGQLTIEQAQRGIYKPAELRKPLGNSVRAYWLRMTLRRVGDPSAQWMLVLTPVWFYADMYVPRKSGFDHVHSGSVLPPSRRPVPSPLVVFPLPVPEDAPLTVYVRLEGGEGPYGRSNRLDVAFERAEQLAGEARGFNHGQGMYAGIILAMVAYNLVLFFELRERTYLFYSLYILSFGLFLAGRSMMLFDLLWPHAAHWNAVSSFYFAAGSVFFSAVFVRNFLGTRNGPRLLDRAMQAILWIMPAIVLLGVFKSPVVAAPFLAWEALVTSVFFLALGFARLLRGYAPARFFLMGWVTLLGANAFYILIYLGLLNASALAAEDAMQAASAAESILLAFALSERVKALKAENEARQRQYTAELELAVQQRTRELVNMNAQLEAASITDSLTGLRNRRFVDAIMNRMTAEVKRARYGGEQGFLVICIADLDHFKDINDNYGHEYGDIALRMVASVLSGAARGTSLVARWGGEEFLLVDRVRDLQEGEAFAERLRQRVQEEIRVEVPNGEARLTMSVGLAHFPFSRTFPELFSWQEVLAMADHGLYKAKQSGRNCTYLVRAIDDKLKAHFHHFGQEFGSQICHTRAKEAFDLGLIEAVPAEAAISDQVQE